MTARSIARSTAVSVGGTGTVLSFSPVSMFAAGEQGAWLDFTDMSVMSQDSAGTTPVTALEQSVGRVLDKSGRGNHFVQATAANRMVVSARDNLLVNTASTMVSGATGWTGTNVTGVLQGDGSSLITRTSTAAACYTAQTGLSIPVGTVVACRIKAKKATVGNLYGLRMQGTYPDRADAVVNLDTGALAYSGGTSFTGISATVSAVDSDGFYTINLTATTAVSTLVQFIHGPANVASGSWEGTSATLLNGYAKQPHLRYGSTVPRYQLVTTATDYDTVGFPVYCRTDGTNDSLSSTIDLSGTSQLSVFTGFVKTSDAARGILVEFSAAVSTNNGSFAIEAPNSAAAAAITGRSKGTVEAVKTVSSSPAGNPYVVSLLASISTDSLNLRVNGTDNLEATDQGTGNYGSYTCYVGMRAGTSLPASLKLSHLIIRGAGSTSAQYTSTERFITQEMAVTA